MYQAAKESLSKAQRVSRHDGASVALGKVMLAAGDVRGAIDAYEKSLDQTPDNPSLLTTLGLLHLRLGSSYKAFDYLGTKKKLQKNLSFFEILSQFFFVQKERRWRRILVMLGRFLLQLLSSRTTTIWMLHF